MIQHHHLSVRFAPTQQDDLPRALMWGTDRNIPTLNFGSPASFTQVEISLSSLPDPAAYLRDLASLCIGLAEQVDAMPSEVSA